MDARYLPPGLEEASDRKRRKHFGRCEWKAATGPLMIVSTFEASDPIAWRLWHHWNIGHHFVNLHLHSGRNFLTIRILTEGNMTLAYFDFKPAP
jgi:hypothetical protein